MNDNLKASIIEIIVALIIIVLAFFSIPSTREWINGIVYNVQKADDATNYETLRQVENTARAMISSYESDVLMYEQYKNSESEEERSWASAAKVRANKTAVTYNNYILQNSFVWKDNIPEDIRQELEIIE